MTRLRQAFLVLGLSFGVTGCGFHPLYAPRSGEGGGAQAEFGAIQTALIPERSGQLVRQALQQRLDRGTAQAKRYELSVSFSLAADAIGFQQDTTITRLRLVGTATWTLKAIDPPNATVTNGLARSLDGVNILDQQYFEADLAGQAATQRIADALADQITLQLATYFARTPAAS